MNLECRVPHTKSLRALLRKIDADPVHDHYTPCERASPLARQLIPLFVTGTGIALLELTEAGYLFLEQGK
jgi:hypothetical protein